MTTHIKHPLGGKTACGHAGFGIVYVEKDPECGACQRVVNSNNTDMNKRVKCFDKRYK